MWSAAAAAAEQGNLEQVIRRANMDGRRATCPRCPSSRVNLPKMRKLNKALILVGLIQVALDAQDVSKAPTGPAFSIEELEVRRLFGRAEWARGRFFWGVRAITVASTRPLPAPLMLGIFTCQTAPVPGFNDR